MNESGSRLPSVVRLPPRSSLDLALSRAASIATAIVGALALIVMLKTGRFLLVPVTLAVVIGLMLGPVATRLERRGLRSSISAAMVVVAFLAAIFGLATAMAAPLSAWASRLPDLWDRLRLQLSRLNEPLSALRGVREQIREVTGGANVTLSVDDEFALEGLAILAPTLIAQILVFLASLYFFIVTRHDTRIAILKLCYSRRLRWRVAHIFRDVEDLVSHYLLSITLINAGLGVAVGLAMWLVGLPSPVLWGVLAGLLNFIVFVGPAAMAVLLLGAGLASFDTLTGSLLPPLIFLSINAIEAQFVTPMVVGMRLTLNPFVVFLNVVFWLWLWGPAGGFVAIPVLLILNAVAGNILPGLHWLPWNDAGRIQRPTAG